MPENEDTVGAQLEIALELAKVSQRELARRLAVADGTKPESKRRWLAKVLADEVEEPEPASVAAIAKALELPPDHFKVTPAIRQSRRQTIASLQAQLAADLRWRCSTSLGGNRWTVSVVWKATSTGWHVYTAISQTP